MRARPHDGYSLIELILGMALITPFLLIVAQLLFEAQWTLGGVARQSRAATPEFATTVLRRDLRAARSTVEHAIRWSDGPLTLRLGDGGTIRYELLDGRLRRKQEIEDEEATGLAVLEQVVRWRWREEYPGLVEVEIDYRSPAPPALRARDGFAWRDERGSRDRTVRLLIGLRGTGGGFRW